MKKTCSFLLLLLITYKVPAQDLSAARKILNTLTSAAFWGRGYTNNGMEKTAAYLSDAFRTARLKPMDGKDFNQYFNYPANTFPGKMEVTINGKTLSPGRDFIIDPPSIGLKATALLVKQDSTTFISRENRLLVRLADKLTWSVAQQTENYTGIQVDKKAISAEPRSITIDVENQFIPTFKASNICGIVKGTRNPDSVILMTAHYDHLGGMGKDTFFPGANDNGSGISLLLSLARYYAKNPAPYSIAFICFAGEEAGIMGSGYFTANPLIALNRVRFMINVDMVGTGSDGITVVNATLHPREFDLLKKINTQKNYLSKINSRGKAANSDHHFFTEKGVPAFFIYTQGGIAAYHDINDVAKTLPLNEFEDLFKLFKDFNRALMQ